MSPVLTQIPQCCPYFPNATPNSPISTLFPQYCPYFPSLVPISPVMPLNPQYYPYFPNLVHNSPILPLFPPISSPLPQCCLYSPHTALNSPILPLTSQYCPYFPKWGKTGSEEEEEGAALGFPHPIRVQCCRRSPQNAILGLPAVGTQGGSNFEVKEPIQAKIWVQGWKFPVPVLGQPKRLCPLQDPIRPWAPTGPGTSAHESAAPPVV